MTKTTSFKLSTLAAAFAAAVTTSAALLAPVSQAHAAGNPDQGVRCPAGFEGQLSGNAFKCVKTVTVNLSGIPANQCQADAPFDNFQKQNGFRDLCVHRDSNIPSNVDPTAFDNGQVVIRIPVGAALPKNLAGRTPLRTINGERVFRLNENADFIFYDRSKTLNAKAAITLAAQERANEIALGVQRDEVNARLLQVSTTQVDASGSLDKIEGRISVTTFAKP